MRDMSSASVQIVSENHNSQILAIDELTDRQKREREYYDQFSELTKPSSVTFDPVQGDERRPWNSYWYLYECVRNLFCRPGQRLLDFGCGNGAQAVRFASIGYDVYGFDNSPNNIAIARELADKYEFSRNSLFSVQKAENLDYPDSHFDVVVGMGILHHVEVVPAVREAMRVLKREGTAIFLEPVDVPAFDRPRNSRLGKWLVPNDSSLDRNITEDERKLNKDELNVLCNSGKKFSVKRFLMFSRLNRFLARPWLLRASTLERFDQHLFRFLPIMSRFGGMAVFQVTK